MTYLNNRNRPKVRTKSRFQPELRLLSRQQARLHFQPLENLVQPTKARKKESKGIIRNSVTFYGKNDPLLLKAYQHRGHLIEVHLLIFRDLFEK